MMFFLDLLLKLMLKNTGKVSQRVSNLIAKMDSEKKQRKFHR